MSLENITFKQVEDAIAELKKYEKLKERLVMFLFDLMFSGDVYYKTQSYEEDFNELISLFEKDWVDASSKKLKQDFIYYH